MAPIEVTPEILAQRILPMLPQDGTPVLNRVMRVMLSRQLEIQIEPELYFAARDLLLQNGKIGRSRGQSGQIFLAALNGSQPATAEPALPAEPWPEARLMQPLRTYLERAFRRGLDLPADSISLVQDSSAKGQAKGLWARPDFILVSAMRFKFMPGAQVDVHSFELRTETGCSVLSVHEALAQTRFTHFGVASAGKLQVGSAPRRDRGPLRRTWVRCGNRRYRWPSKDFWKRVFRLSRKTVSRVVWGKS
jgi:hypothetical protein